MSTTQFTNIQKRTMKLQALQVFNFLDKKERLEKRIETLKERLEEKQKSIEEEIAEIDTEISTADAYIVSKTGYSATDIFEKVTKETGKLDDNGNPITRTTIDFKYDSVIPEETPSTTEETTEEASTTESTTEETEATEETNTAE